MTALVAIALQTSTQLETVGKANPHVLRDLIFSGCHLGVRYYQSKVERSNNSGFIVDVNLNVKEI